MNTKLKMMEFTHHAIRNFVAEKIGIPKSYLSLPENQLKDGDITRNYLPDSEVFDFHSDLQVIQSIEQDDSLDFPDKTAGEIFQAVMDDYILPDGFRKVTGYVELKIPPFMVPMFAQVNECVEIGKVDNYSLVATKKPGPTHLTPSLINSKLNKITLVYKEVIPTIQAIQRVEPKAVPIQKAMPVEEAVVPKAPARNEFKITNMICAGDIAGDKLLEALRSAAFNEISFCSIPTKQRKLYLGRVKKFVEDGKQIDFADFIDEVRRINARDDFMAYILNLANATINTSSMQISPRVFDNDFDTKE